MYFSSLFSWLNTKFSFFLDGKQFDEMWMALVTTLDDFLFSLRLVLVLLSVLLHRGGIIKKRDKLLKLAFFGNRNQTAKIFILG